MKARLVSILLAGVVLFASSRQAAADSDFGSDSGLGAAGAVFADALVVRPLCFGVLILGAGLFVVALPVAAGTHSVSKTADALLREPAEQTFQRKLGDFSGLEH